MLLRKVEKERKTCHMDSVMIYNCDPKLVFVKNHQGFLNKSEGYPNSETSNRILMHCGSFL